MNRYPAKPLWIGEIPIAVVLVFIAGCSSPTQDVAKDASAVKAVPATTTSASGPLKGPTTAVPTTAPPAYDAPTPAETPVPLPPSVAAATDNRQKNPQEPAPDPLKWMQDKEARRVEYEKSLVQLGGDRDAAKALVAKSERDLLALRNPYLARPELTPDEAAAIQGMNGAERVQWAESRVANAIASWESAKKAYDDAKANPPLD